MNLKFLTWDGTMSTKNENKLFVGLDSSSRFYHVHSYYVVLNDMSYEIAQGSYGKTLPRLSEKIIFMVFSFTQKKVINMEWSY